MGDSSGSLSGPPDRGRDLRGSGQRPLPARLLDSGARGAQRVARAAGVEGAAEAIAEEAIVRAIESQATERALARVLQGPVVEEAVENAMRSPAVERALNDAIDSEMIDRVWERLLASDEAQKLVERIAEAPEVRSAIAAQGVGLLDDVRREAARATHRADDTVQRIVRRLFFRPAPHPESGRAGVVSRAIALVLDGVILNAAFLVLSGLITLVATVVFNADGASAPVIAIGAGLWAVIGSLYLVAFWSLAGQTPGMRFVRVELDSEDGRRIGPRRALRRLVGLVFSILPFGAGLYPVLFSDQRRGWHDRYSGTEVIYADTAAAAAPWAAGPKPAEGAAQ